MIAPRVPTRNTSSSRGSSVVWSRWAESTSSRLPATASSSARIDLGRPTKSGTTAWG